MGGCLGHWTTNFSCKEWHTKAQAGVVGKIVTPQYLSRKVCSTWDLMRTKVPVIHPSIKLEPRKGWSEVNHKLLDAEFSKMPKHWKDFHNVQRTDLQDNQLVIA
jgi:hypothetical protein